MEERYSVLYFYDGNRIYGTPEIKGMSALHAPAVHLWMGAIMPTTTSGDFPHLKYF